MDHKRTIILVLFEHGAPMRQSELVNATGLSPQLLRYHLKDLCENGVVITTKFGNYTLYALEKIFYSIETFLMVGEMLEKISDEVISSGVEDNTRAVNVIEALVMVLVDLTKIQMPNSCVTGTESKLHTNQIPF